MNVSVELDDDLARALLELTGVEGLEEAVVIAIKSFVRHERLGRFRALKGKVDIMSNEELEAADLERNRQLWGDAYSDETQDQIHSQEPESRTVLLQRLQGRYTDIEESLADELVAERRKEAEDEG